MDREQRARAGAWLRRAREERGVSVRKVAAYFDVSTQSVYGWEAGASDFVDDDRAAGLAVVLGMGIIEVRRGLGLWVPPADQRESGAPASLNPSDEELLAMVPAAIAERDRGNPEAYNLLMAVWHMRHPEARETTQPNATSNEADKTA